MSSELVSLVVIILLAIAGFLLYRIYVGIQNRKNEALFSSKKLEAWMAAEAFSPDHFSFFRGTGIALKDGDKRIVLYSAGAAQFYPLADIAGIKVYETMERGIPLGAAPGVVELNEAMRFIIDIAIKTAPKPCKLLFASKDLSRQWEARLNALITAEKTVHP